MQIKLDLNAENVLSPEAARAIVTTIRALQERAEKAEAEAATLAEALKVAVDRAEGAEASLARVREVVALVIADLTAPS